MIDEELARLSKGDAPELLRRWPWLVAELAGELLETRAEVRRLRVEPSLQISLAEGQSYVTPTGWRMTMRDGTMVMDHEKVRVSYEYWNEAEQRWQAGVVENGPGK